MEQIQQKNSSKQIVFLSGKEHFVEHQCYCGTVSYVGNGVPKWVSKFCYRCLTDILNAYRNTENRKIDYATAIKNMGV